MTHARTAAYLMMALSPVLFLIPLIGEAFKEHPEYNYKNEDTGATCTNTEDENDRIRYFTQVALCTYLICMITANARYTIAGVKDYLEENESLDMANIFVFVVTGMLYPMALAILGSEFTWGLTCNSYDETNKESTTSLLWTALFLWLFASALMHSASKGSTYSLLSGGD